MSRSCIAFNVADKRIFRTRCCAGNLLSVPASLTFAPRAPILISRCRRFATSRDKSKLKMTPNTDSRFAREIRIANELARAAGAVLLRHYHTPFLVEQKVNALQEMEEVTAADREANDLIVNRLSAEFPDDGILAEESKDTERRLEKERVWLIDPMDGTKNFVQRDGDFAVQIGLSVAGESVVGTVYQPVREVLYWASKGVGSWIEDANRPRRQM